MHHCTAVIRNDPRFNEFLTQILQLWYVTSLHYTSLIESASHYFVAHLHKSSRKSENLVSRYWAKTTWKHFSNWYITTNVIFDIFA